jgi:hypothetical protein
MPAHRSLCALRRLAPALLLAALAPSLGCATLTRPDRAQVNFLNAPHDLKVLDESGQALPMADGEAGAKKATVGWKTRKVTLQTGGKSTPYELPALFGLGYFIADYLMLIFPIAIDFGTGKWTNFQDVDVPAALAEAKKNPATDQPPSKPLVSSAPASKPAAPPPQPVVQQASAQPAVVAAVAPAAAAAGGRTPVVSTGKLAVLDFKSYTDALKPQDVRYFADVVRGATLRTAPGLQVMTRENLLVLLQATGKDAATCEGECEVETGRRIGADAVVSGELLKVGSRFKLSLKLHDTHEGRLLSTAVANGRTIDELDEAAQAAAADLLSPALH